MTPLKIIFAFVFVLSVCWLFRLFFFAPVEEVTESRDFMTPEEQEALEIKARLQREMRERERALRSKLSNRINQ